MNNFLPISVLSLLCNADKAAAALVSFSKLTFCMIEKKCWWCCAWVACACMVLLKRGKRAYEGYRFFFANFDLFNCSKRREHFAHSVLIANAISNIQITSWLVILWLMKQMNSILLGATHVCRTLAASNSAVRAKYHDL